MMIHFATPSFNGLQMTSKEILCPALISHTIDKQINFACRFNRLSSQTKSTKPRFLKKSFINKQAKFIITNSALLALWLAFCASSHGHYSYVWA